MDAEVVETQFPADVTTPRLPRDFLRGALQTWSLDGLGEVTELLTDELVSNVVRHVGRPMTVRAIRGPSTVRVEVDDRSTDVPMVQHPGPDAPRGRGLELVDGLADRWGTEPREDGKTVWFEIDHDAATHSQFPTRGDC
jgi:anti-sigma regulatory factor (Ser/Thr protein kinase)